ncbi:MAG: hypothetical protein ABSG37_07180 [Candidatus Limnocylindrales bacterium]|jgi:hypothetical protein
MSGPGRRTDAELAMIRDRVEGLMNLGYRSPAIHRALTGPEAPRPIVISERSVRSNMAVVERRWRERASREHLEAEHAKAIAIAEDTHRTALARSARNADNNVGVGYMNTALKAQELIVRLRGLDAPIRTEIAGPGGGPVAVALADHPAEHLDPREQARRLRAMADDAQAEADELEEHEGSEP